MDDEAGCLSLHLVCGFTAFLGAMFIAPRLGKFEPLQHNVEELGDEESEEEERPIVSAQALLKKKSQK